jgi:hypothetical protein
VKRISPEARAGTAAQKWRWEAYRKSWQEHESPPSLDNDSYADQEGTASRLQLKITLLEIEPRIWRIIQVPSSIKRIRPSNPVLNGSALLCDVFAQQCNCFFSV